MHDERKPAPRLVSELSPTKRRRKLELDKDLQQPAVDFILVLQVWTMAVTVATLVGLCGWALAGC